jgi:hypothetical protein
VTDDLEGRSAPDAYGGSEGREACARCGHTAPTCERCGVDHPLLGAGIGDERYCHTFVEQGPTCYMLTQWERPREELRSDPLTSGLAAIFDKRTEPPRSGLEA